MKKLILPALFFICIHATAQIKSDSSGSDENFPPRKPDPTAQQQQLSTHDYNDADPLIRIRMDAIPSPLRKTLKGSEYSGWEESPLFKNKKTLEYLIDIRSGDSLRTFRFDKFGNPIND
jgi:hypothetical protein